MSVNGTPTSTGWIGPWILITITAFAVLSPTRSPFMVAVFFITAACGAALCVHGRQVRRHG